MEIKGHLSNFDDNITYKLGHAFPAVQQGIQMWEWIHKEDHNHDIGKLISFMLIESMNTRTINLVTYQNGLEQEVSSW